MRYILQAASKGRHALHSSATSCSADESKHSMHAASLVGVSSAATTVTECVGNCTAACHKLTGKPCLVCSSCIQCLVGCRIVRQVKLPCLGTLCSDSYIAWSPAGRCASSLACGSHSLALHEKEYQLSAHGTILGEHQSGHCSWQVCHRW